ncbi:hypothetical protein MNBD_BACTEROID05-576 [hydrothermal vent metagenome]|uniref:ABC transmembrane type-1 domain-containing protein n=1 Tax=hydrothermal vent metagenome TaxID=652676 RepID=A0A3B0TXJ2_9ZZZZ
MYLVKNFVKESIIHLFLIIVSVTCVFPLMWMFRASIMTKETIFTEKTLIPSSFNWHNFVTAWVKGNFGVYFLNSFFYTVCVVVGIVIISSLAAYAFSRLKFAGKNFFFYMFVLAMMIPLPGSFVPLVVLMNKLHLVDTRLGYIVCMINVGLSMSVLLYKTFFDKMSADLEDAARIDGCGKFGIYWNVAMPLAKPVTAVVVIFNSLSVWNEFILANLILTSDTKLTLQTGLFKFQGANLADYPVLMAGLTIAVVPILIVYLLMQKHIIKGLSSGAVVG